jgi:hypothetical protein
MVRKKEQNIKENDDKVLSSIFKKSKGQQKDFDKCVSIDDLMIIKELKEKNIITDEQIAKVKEIKDKINEKSLIEENNTIEVIDMGLLSKKEPENKLSENDLETIKSVFDDTFNTFDNGNEDKMKDIETVKIIIKELLAVDKHLPSTTKLNPIQVTELAQAKYLNSFFKSPIIDLYMNQFMKLKRSETKEITTNLLDGLLSIGNTSMHGNNQFDESKGILGSRWKR